MLAGCEMKVASGDYSVKQNPTVHKQTHEDVERKY
jgi:hypothetical protein